MGICYLVSGNFSDAPYYVKGVSTYQENPYPHLGGEDNLVLLKDLINAKQDAIEDDIRSELEGLIKNTCVR